MFSRFTGNGRRHTHTGSADIFDEDFLRRLELLQVAARRLMRGKARGERKTKRVGSGLEFADHREYSPGDDIRKVDWNVLARLDQTLVRLYEEDEDLPLRLVVDVSDSMLTHERSKFLFASKVAAALGYVGLAGLDRVGVTTMSRTIYETLPAVRGKARIFRIFDFLRTTKLGGETDIRSGCSRVANASGPPGVTVILSDFYDLDGAFDGLSRLKSRNHQPVCLQIVDPKEIDLLDAGVRGDVRLVDCEAGTELDVTLNSTTLRAYADAHKRFCAALSSKCRARSIPYFCASTQMDVDDLVLRILRRGGVLR